MSADTSTVTTKTKAKTKKTAQVNKQTSQNLCAWIALIIAALACAGVAYLLIGAQKQKATLQQSLQSYQAQMSTLQTQATQTQTAMQNNMQQALQKSQSKLQQALAQLNQGKQQADKQIALSSVVYLVRMANLALLINQDPKVATHFLDLAQSRLQDMPAMESLRASIVNEKEKLIAVPQIDVDGLLMQLGGLKKVIMTLPNTPHWTKASAKAAPANKQASTLSQKASADWSTLWCWLKRFIIISHRENDPNVLPTPEHFQSVQDSVYLGLSTAQWAVLHKNTQVYSHAITAAIGQLKTIQQGDPKVVDQVLNQLMTLEKSAVNPHYPNLDALMNQVVTMQGQSITLVHATGSAMTAPATQPTTTTAKSAKKITTSMNQEVVA